MSREKAERGSQKRCRRRRTAVEFDPGDRDLGVLEVRADIFDRTDAFGAVLVRRVVCGGASARRRGGEGGSDMSIYTAGLDEHRLWQNAAVWPPSQKATISRSHVRAVARRGGGARRQVRTADGPPGAWISVRFECEVMVARNHHFSLVGLRGDELGECLTPKKHPQKNKKRGTEAE